MAKDERDNLLRALADRFLAEAAALGFSADQLVANLVSRLGKGHKEHIDTLESKD